MQQIIEADKLVLEGRKRLSMTGVKKVDGFSETYLKLTVGESRVVVSGEAIKITSFNESNGNLIAEGSFFEIKYDVKKKPILKRIFK